MKSPWKTPLGKFYPYGALIVGNYYVWKVKVLGARPRDYFVNAPVEAFSVADVASWEFSDGVDTLPFATYVDLPDPIPWGLIAISRYRLAVLWQSAEGSRCSEPGPASTPPDVEEYTWVWNRCFEGYDDSGYEIRTPLVAHGWKVSLDTLFRGSLDATGMPDSPNTYYVNGEELTQAEIEQRLRDLLSSSDPDYNDLADWFSANLGGDARNPKDVYTTAPSCGGVTVATCTNRLRTAGFTGTITTSTLSTDEAVMERPAGRVADTSPRSGQQIAKGQAIILYVNPTPMPTMTATQTAVASTLKTKNPTTVTDANKKTLARRCVKYAIAAGRATSDCTLLPILLQGNEIPTTARNEIVALARNPVWFASNRRVTPIRTGWYVNRADPSPACLDAERTPAGAQCDEFPFWSTLQAYGGTLNTAVPGIRWVPRPENQRQGNVLSQFYSANAAGPSLPFKGCNIAAQSPTDVAPIPTSAFLNLAVPVGEGFSSRGICNKP